MHKKGIYEKYFKRPIDFILSLSALIVLFPLLLIIAILVKIKLGSPVIFKQERPGLNENIFHLYKFRTMTNKKDDKGILLPDKLRLTNLGKALRSTSLDELPSLVNIIKGDISLVGPRPQLVKDMYFMTKEQRERHLVRPGLTGLAQVSGRNNISWEDKFKFDLDYIKKIRFITDVKIIFKTLSKVLAQKDINPEGYDTSEDLSDYLLRSGKITITQYEEKLNNMGDQDDL